MRKVVIIEALRTPIGKFGGSLRNVSAEDLAAIVIEEIFKKSGVEKKMVDCVILGQTRQSTKANNLAKVVALKTKLPETTKGYTVNMLCGSGMKALHLAAMEIMSGSSDVILAGGTENMSETPYYIRNARFGEGKVELIDANLEGGTGAVPIDIYGKDLGMGITAENVAEKYRLTRTEQDTFALNSQNKCNEALKKKKFDREIVSVEIKSSKGTILVDQDEFPRPETTMESLTKLRPAFKKDGTVTAGNSCGRNDAACVILMMEEQKALELGLKPLARFVGCEEVGVPPEIMGVGPIPATRKLLEKTRIKMDDIGLIELNEAFASQAIACINELGMNDSLVNVNGGAIALGHPLGCTGARIVTSLVHEMKRRNVTYGLATQCIGGGQGIASLWQLL